MTAPAPHELDELKAYLGYRPEDAARLRDLWPAVERRLDRIVDHFYEKIQATPGAMAVMRDEAQVHRLKGTLRTWIRQLCVGPHDYDYYARQQRIGRVHVQVGLPARYMFTAMSVLRDDLCDVAAEVAPPEAQVALAGSIQRVTAMDLAIMTCTYVEAREERQLASLQELIVSNMPVTVLLVDGHGRVTATTATAARMLGLHEVTGRHYLEVLPAPLVAAADLEANLARALATGREISLLRVDAALDGRPRSFRVTVVPLEHPQARALLHVEEMTEAIDTEARLRQAEALAQLGAFSAAVAHELRNPLAGISGAVQVIARSLPAADARRPVMEKVEGQIQRLNAMISELLAFARPAEPRLATVDLGEASRGVVELVEREHPGVRIGIEGAGHAVADPHHVQQVVLNLVQNAAQAAGPGGEVLVRIAPGRIRVSDSGPGVAAELRESIFLPFFTTKTQGTGLGLAISRQLAQAMGGRLALVQGPLAGAAFELELPEAPGR